MSSTEILRTLSDAIGFVKIRSVVDNLSRFILVFFLLIIGAAALNVAEWLLIVFCVILCVAFLLMVFAYIYFSLKNPDYLRSEDYHLRKQSIELLGDKENLLPVDPKEIRSIANPYQEIQALEVREDMTDE